MMTVHALALLHPAAAAWASLPFAPADRLPGARKFCEVIQPSGKQYKPLRSNSLPWSLCYKSTSSLLLLVECLNDWLKLLRSGVFYSSWLLQFLHSQTCHYLWFVLAQRKGAVWQNGHWPHCPLPLQGTWLWMWLEFCAFILSWQLRLLRPSPCPFETVINRSDLTSCILYTSGILKIGIDGLSFPAGLSSDHILWCLKCCKLFLWLGYSYGPPIIFPMLHASSFPSLW